MTTPRPGTTPLSREQAQQRADRIGAFREELAALEREEALLLTQEQRDAVDRHHSTLLEQLAGTFDVDRTERQKRLSAGMKAATLLGALALAAALYTFFYRFWGGMPVALQAAVVVLSPILLVAGMEVAARREKTLYVTLLLGLLAGTSFVIGLPVLAGLFNVALPPTALLAWAAFCGALAYAYGLRLLLVAALFFGLGFTGTLAGPTDHCVWEAFGRRPETFLLAGALLFGVPRLAPHRTLTGFPSAWRTLGLLALFLPILILGRVGNASFLRFSPGTIEAGYQLLGFVLAALAVWLGVRSAWPEVTNVAAGAFVVYLYVKLYDWWWAFLPRWVFFLLLGLVAVGLLLLLRRFHARSRRSPA
ncbi:MAG TPA: DUF2157 domain-containing protein [Thermoanaerobaculia bacterium]|nr:DUF2157 domain-containing protein [Thermoanaerobaculia bacterium]